MMPSRTAPSEDPGRDKAATPETSGQERILSFDVEEHFRIEQASALTIDPELKHRCGERLEPMTRWILDALARLGQKATFFVVGRIARERPSLVRAIHDGGHEVASHSWEHHRVHALTPAAFLEDTRKSKDALEQVTGAAVLGYRAPTFSVVRQTAWALDILADLGFRYDSSIFPIYHDRYGVPQAPRGPFLARGERREILEFPPATLKLIGLNVPAGGGGYFRLFPLAVLHAALRQLRRGTRPSVGMLYFHPWEFDPGQPRLPLRGLGRFRTYVGIGRSRDRLESLLTRYRFARTIDVAERFQGGRQALPRFCVAEDAAPDRGVDERPASVLISAPVLASLGGPQSGGLCRCVTGHARRDG
jgi:polysaccharide deacetylase family protein (PEP-CTERM system associated)